VTSFVLVQKQLRSSAVIVCLVPIPKCEVIDGQVLWRASRQTK
jgi:hypothetical protein